jgi:ATP-dependent DNA helicase RecG
MLVKDHRTSVVGARAVSAIDGHHGGECVQSGSLATAAEIPGCGWGQPAFFSQQGRTVLKTIVISDDELAEIADRDESHFFDIKEHAASGRSIQKAAAAFSNADGGELIIGIKDKRTSEILDERWEGIADIEQMNRHLQALFEVKPALDITYEFLRRETVSGYALRVLIEKGTQVCAAPDGKIYLRQGAQSLPVKDPDRVQQLSFAKGATSFEDAVLADLPAEQIVDSSILSSFLADYSPKNRPARILDQPKSTRPQDLATENRCGPSISPKS